MSAIVAQLLINMTHDNADELRNPTPLDSVTRFSSRVEDYARYRPTYPAGLLEILRTNCGLTNDSIIADVGSGTGLLAELFLKEGNQVFGVEPNAGMRSKAETLLARWPRFISVDATAENTGLQAGTIDFVTAAQAFHWFDQAAAKKEFARVLKSSGWCVLIWNARRTDTTAFLRAYESLLLRYNTDYEEVRHENVDEQIADFFSPVPVTTASLENVQRFDFESLKGRLCSSSYALEPAAPNFETMIAELREIFEAHNENGIVNFEYDTKIYYGQLSRLHLTPH